MAELLNLGTFIALTFIVVFGLGVGIWKYTRPKAVHWTAHVYQRAKGIRPPLKNRKGEYIRKISLCDLKPYMIDVLREEVKDKGITVFELAQLKITTPPVTADNVEVWGEEKIVRVLYENGVATLLESGYDAETQHIVFNPIPRSRMDQIRSDLAVKRENLSTKETDILTKVLPFAALIMGALAMIGIAYLSVNGFIKISDTMAESSAKQAEVTLKLVETIEKLDPESNIINRGSSTNNDRQQIPTPPSVE